MLTILIVFMSAGPDSPPLKEIPSTKKNVKASQLFLKFHNCTAHSAILHIDGNLEWLGDCTTTIAFHLTDF